MRSIPQQVLNHVATMFRDPHWAIDWSLDLSVRDPKGVVPHLDEGMPGRGTRASRHESPALLSHIANLKLVPKVLSSLNCLANLVCC